MGSEMCIRDRLIMMSLVRAQLGEPQQSSLLTTLFSFLSKFTAKSGEKVSVKKKQSCGLLLVNWDCASAV